jgi:hypothetical protein
MQQTSKAREIINQNELHMTLSSNTSPSSFKFRKIAVKNENSFEGS